MLAVFATNKTQNQTTQENLAKTEHFEREREAAMEWVREGRMVGLAAVLACAIMVMVPEVEAIRWIVGSNKGWTTNVNYTIWAQDKHFYNGDWLFFVYDRNLMDVLEVNKTDYESCNSDHPLKNWTTKVGRDVVPLNETRQYYFISGKGFCYGGMKLTVLVENPPPPPTASPITSSSPSSIYRGQIVLPVVFAVGAMWDTFIRFW